MTGREWLEQQRARHVTRDGHGGGGYRYCEADNMDWPCPTSRLIAALAMAIALMEAHIRALREHNQHAGESCIEALYDSLVSEERG